MGTLNWSRIMLGGLLAGVVINAGELIAAGFLRKQYQAAMQSLGRSLEVLTAWDLALSLLVTSAWVFLLCGYTPQSGLVTELGRGRR